MRTEVPFTALLLCLVLPPEVRAQREATADTAVQYSLYNEAFQAGDYGHALPYLRWMLEHAPGFYASGRADDRNFRRAVQLYDTLAARAENDAAMLAYLDTALVLHDQAIEKLGAAGVAVDRFKWILEKGRFIQNHPTSLEDLQDDAIALYEEAYRLNPEGIDPYYVIRLISHHAKRDKQRAVELMDEAESRYPDNADLVTYIAQVRNALFRTPEERVEFLEQQFEKKPGDAAIASELFSIYRELGMREKAYAMGDRLSEMDPSAATYRILAKLRLDDGEAAEAFQLYEQIVAMDGQGTVHDYYNMGIAQQQMGGRPQARGYFRRALEIEPKFGPAFLAIGDLYAGAVSDCGSFERKDQAVYWLVVDYYNRAIEADPSVANAANSKIRTYMNSYPDAEALFILHWNVGDSYRIDYGCYSWIGEATTVKEAP